MKKIIISFFVIFYLFIAQSEIYATNDCTVGNLIVKHNQSALFYSTNWASKNMSCESVSRSCIDGILSGDSNFNETDCKDAGMSIGIYAYARGQEPTVEEEKYIDTAYIRYNPYFLNDIGDGDEVFNTNVNNLIDVIVDKMIILKNKNIDTILDFQFIENKSNLSFHSVEEVINLLDRLILKLDMNELSFKSITLGEENIWHFPSTTTYSSSGKTSRKDYFNEIYTILSEKYPNELFFQWYSPVSGENQRAPGHVYIKNNKEKIVPVFKADGLVIDQYKYDRVFYEFYVAKAKEHYDNLYSVIWASPNWDISKSGSKKIATSSWWNNIRWENFYDKVAINQENNIDTSFYMYSLYLDEELVKKAKFLGTDDAGFECEKKFYDDFMKITIPYISTHTISLDDRPDSKPFWIPTYDSECTVPENTNDCRLGDLLVKQGESALFYNRDYAHSGRECKSKTRTCNGGVLSGAEHYKYGFCEQAKISIGIHKANNSTITYPEKNYYDMAIVEYSPLNLDEVNSFDIAVSEILHLNSQGIDVVLNYNFLENIQLETLPDSGDILGYLNELIYQLGEEGIDLNGVTIGNGNFWWTKSRFNFLNGLYTTFSTSYPEISFFQWYYTNQADKLHIPGYGKAKILKADSLIVDQRKLSIFDYESYVKNINLLKEEGEQVYKTQSSIIYFSPNWDRSVSGKVLKDNNWWNQEGWKDFYRRVVVSKNNNVGMIFNSRYLDEGKDTHLSDGSNCEREFYNYFYEFTIPYITINNIPAIVPDAKPFWIPTYDTDC